MSEPVSLAVSDDDILARHREGGHNPSMEKGLACGKIAAQLRDAAQDLHSGYNLPTAIAVPDRLRVGGKRLAVRVHRRS